MFYHPDAVRRTSSEEGHHAVNEARFMDGVAYAPADAMKLGYEGASFDQPRGVGLLFMSVNDVGISIAMPPPRCASSRRSSSSSPTWPRRPRPTPRHRRSIAPAVPANERRSAGARGMKTHRHPGSQSADDHHGPLATIHFGADISLPGQLMLCSHAAPDGRSRGGYGIVRLELPGTSIKLHVTLSPSGLRWLARQAEELAKDLEATAAREAADAIERARGAGK
jgi:hypothetical protein